MWTSWGSISYRLTNRWQSEHLATSCLIVKSQTHSLHNSVILCLLATAAVVSHSVYLGRNICLGPEQTACFLGAFQFTCSGSEDHCHKPALRVLIRCHPLKVKAASLYWGEVTLWQSFTRTKHDLGSAFVELPNLVFAQLPGLLKKTPRVALDVTFGFGSRWWHNAATLSVASNIRFYQEPRTCQQMKRRGRL